MNKKSMQKLGLLIAGVALVGLLTGCGGSTSTAAADNGNSAANGSGQHNGQHNGGGKGNRGGMNIEQRLQDAGASADDAKALMQLVRDNHVQIKWVLDQLNNKVPVSTITDDIKNGKAPKMTQNGNGHWGGKKSGTGGNGSNGTSNESLQHSLNIS